MGVLVATHWLDQLKLLGQQSPIVGLSDSRLTIRQLYRGVVPAIIETGFYNGFQFGFYEAIKLLWQRQVGAVAGTLVPPISQMLMGLAAGCLTQTCTCPIKVLAIRIGAGATGEKSMGEACRNILKESGLGGFWRGNMTGLTSQPLTIALTFYFFERFRFYAEAAYGASQLVTAVTGGLAQATACLLIYPLRIAKDKIQAAKSGEFTGMSDVLGKAYRRHGLLKGVYGGVASEVAGNFVKKGLTFW